MTTHQVRRQSLNTLPSGRRKKRDGLDGDCPPTTSKRGPRSGESWSFSSAEPRARPQARPHVPPSTATLTGAPGRVTDQYSLAHVAKLRARQRGRRFPSEGACW